MREVKSIGSIQIYISYVNVNIYRRIAELILKLSFCFCKGAAITLECSEKLQRVESKKRGFREQMSHILIKNITAKTRKKKDTQVKTLTKNLIGLNIKIALIINKI